MGDLIYEDEHGRLERDGDGRLKVTDFGPYGTVLWPNEGTHAAWLCAALERAQADAEEYREHAEAAADAYVEMGATWLLRIPKEPAEPHTASSEEPRAWVTASELDRVLSGLAGIKAERLPPPEAAPKETNDG